MVEPSSRYGDFLEKLYATAGDNVNGSSLAQFNKDLLETEVYHGKPGAYREALYDHPFNLTGIKTKEVYASGINRGWSYLEMAMRVRKIWETLWNLAKAVPKEYDNNYIRYFMDSHVLTTTGSKQSPQSPLMEGLFPETIRLVLTENQNVVEEMNSKRLDKNMLLCSDFRSVLSEGDTKQSARELLVPWVQGVTGAQEGPVGPLSLEAAFMLSLQVAGIDICKAIRWYRDHNVPDPAPPEVLCGAKFHGVDLKDTVANPKEVIRADPGLLNSKIDAVHNSTTKDKHASETIGFYCGIDLYSTPIPCATPESSMMFGFICHPVDVATAVVRWNEAVMVPPAPETRYGVYVTSREAKLPDQNISYPRAVHFTKHKIPGLIMVENACPEKEVKEATYGRDDSLSDGTRQTDPHGKPVKPGTQTGAPARRVRAHCHAAFWSRAAFEAFFKLKKPEVKPGEPEINLGYDQISDGNMHMYLISESDASRYPRAKWWTAKKGNDWKSTKI